MIGILGGMGTQAGLDFCNKLALINRGKTDQQYPLFILYNKSSITKRPENIKKHVRRRLRETFAASSFGSTDFLERLHIICNSFIWHIKLKLWP